VIENALFAVAFGPNHSVVLKAKFQGQRELIMAMKGLEAELLGRSLLLAGAVAYAREGAAGGAEITNGHLPVQSFFIDPDSRHDPVLLFELPGGAKLTFQLLGKMAEECGELLYMAGL
jgi:hypothetical protein